MQLRRLRIMLRCPVIFQTDWYIAEGEIINVSLPGCAIETPRCLIPGEYVRLHLLLPDEAVRIDVGKVRWCEPYRFGVEFLKLPDLQARVIHHAMKTQALVRLS